MPNLDRIFPCSDRGTNKKRSLKPPPGAMLTSRIHLQWQDKDLRLNLLKTNHLYRVRGTRIRFTSICKSLWSGIHSSGQMTIEFLNQVLQVVTSFRPISDLLRGDKWPPVWGIKRSLWRSWNALWILGRIPLLNHPWTVTSDEGRYKFASRLYSTKSHLRTRGRWN